MNDHRGPADMSEPGDGADVPVDATPEYLDVLRQASGRVPTRDVDWGAFHARLNERAVLPLARLRASSARGAEARPRGSQRAVSWLEYAALPSRLWRPIAAAATIAIIAGIHALSSDVSPLETLDTIGVATSDIMGARGAFESAVTAGTSSGSIASYLVPSETEGARSATSDSSTGQ